MKSVEYYRGREQTYLKHFFLERYLERVAYNIGSFAREFVYVDGFSGPWQSEDEAFEDTSFVIALHQLRRVREGLAKIGRAPRIRCIFVEKDEVAFRSLEKAVQNVRDMDVHPIHGEFESAIPEVLRRIGRSFALVFIDPTGWTGFGLRKIEPILQHTPGEVLVNFMFDHINRFLDHPGPEIGASFTELFGGSGWEAAVRATARREDAIVDLYRERMRIAGKFPCVSSTRILKPTSDRSYFYLVYGTRNWKGLLEFRGVEKKAVGEQERVRLTAKQIERIERTSQPELFSAAELAGGPASFEEERAARLGTAFSQLSERLQRRGRTPYEEVVGQVLESPLVWESDLKAMITELRTKGQLEIEGLEGRQRMPRAGCRLVWKHA